MGKGYKNKTCVYCGREGCSETADHVVAREFFLKSQRANLPKVPSCAKCNGEKSSLEHYLTTVLPFGGRHADATTNLSEMVPQRLEKNAKLRRHLISEKGRIWSEEAGLLLPHMTLPIDSDKLNQLFCYIIKGLIWHHWGLLLPCDYFIGASSLTKEGESFFLDLFNKNPRREVNVSLGKGTFKYEGRQGTDDPYITLWRFTIYGGVVFSESSLFPSEKTSITWGLTCHNSLNPNYIFQ
ncbi:MAG: HNH endonuclease [Alphaproteobacteria bacterium]|nr:HNH endonuclease [Alphaproteobacteria bacterium]